MKIIYYSPHPYLNLSQPSGYGTHMREMIRAFEKKGHEVFPIIAGGLEIVELKKQKDFKRKGINLFRRIIPTFLWESIKDYRLQKFDQQMNRRLLDEIKTIQPDLIYERGNYLQNSGVLAAKKMKVKHFMELNAPYVSEREELQGKSYFLDRAIEVEKELISKTDVAFVISSALKEHLLEKHPRIAEDKIQVIPNAINEDAFCARPALTKKLVGEYGLEDQTVVGFVGSIFKWHGVDILIKAFYKVSDEFPKAKLLIVGSGSIMEDLIELVKVLKISDRVIFTGNVPYVDVPSYIDMMDITVIANTNWYCSPIKIFEYGLMKKAIIAPDYSPVTEVMTQEQDGLIVEPDYDNISEALHRVLSDPELRQRLSSSFHTRILNRYTWDGNATQVLSYL